MRHRKFARLERLLKNTALARGHLELLWDAAYENGDDLVGSVEDVEILARWVGAPGDLARALLESGFVDESPEGLRVHDLWQHAPDYVENRAKREAARKQKGLTLSEMRAEAGRVGGIASGRARKGQQANGSKRGHLLPLGKANGVTPAPAPAPAPAQEAEASGESSASPPSPPPSTPLGAFLAETWPDIRDPDSFARAQAEACPGVDLLAEAKKAWAWEVANPEKRKKRHGPFLSRWFARTQDQRGGRNGTAEPERPTEPWYPKHIPVFRG